MTKVGRNDPCPCGSGRKVKKCCGDLRALDCDACGRPVWESQATKIRGMLIHNRVPVACPTCMSVSEASHQADVERMEKEIDRLAP